MNRGDSKQIDRCCWPRCRKTLESGEGVRYSPPGRNSRLFCSEHWKRFCAAPLAINYAIGQMIIKEVE